ncbi:MULTISPECIES: hypothetical protein [unclassified Mycobacterium]|uniref:hypothetical protein n=1 Tax=unclassified Mycobacterium TaxID=2642494 RepID=UPI0007FBC037|nr:MULTISPECIES: hypothetical protein [unclassified Mycobacterium]OBI17237.1 hypothetical protein A5713_20520 [Mycobacterium sp. E2497]
MPERRSQTVESDAHQSRTRGEADNGGTQTRRRPSERTRKTERPRLNIPIIGRVRVPHADHLAFYGGLAALAAFQILDWPMALVLGAGQALAESQHDRVVREFGDALSDA